MVRGVAYNESIRLGEPFTYNPCREVFALVRHSKALVDTGRTSVNLNRIVAAYARYQILNQRLANNLPV